MKVPWGLGGAEDVEAPQQQGEQGDGGAGQADVVDGEVYLRLRSKNINRVCNGSSALMARKLRSSSSVL